jgi:Uma2 family endonuclease
MARQIDTPGMEDGVHPFVFNFADFARMGDAGLFADREGRVELIEGKIVQMAPPAGDHTDVTSEIQGGLYIGIKALPESGLRVLSQGTLKIGDHSAPEPDVFVARPRQGRKYYEAGDVELVVEVAVTTLASDRDLKAPLYARAGIPEFWLVVPEDRSVCVHRGPRPEGQWASVMTVTDGAVSPLFAPGIRIPLADIFRVP